MGVLRLPGPASILQSDPKRGILTPKLFRPASASLITSTQVVTLQPVPPGHVAPPSEMLPSATSFLTLSSTEIVTETRTETQTLAVSTISASAGAYTGFASNGWNSSMSTFVTVKSSTIGSVTVAEKLAYFPGTAYPVVSSGVVPLSPGNATRYVKARAAANIVVASIDGVAVSWTNNYDGTSPSPFSTPPVVAPVTATALQSEPVASCKFQRMWCRQSASTDASSSNF